MRVTGTSGICCYGETDWVCEEKEQKKEKGQREQEMWL